MIPVGPATRIFLAAGATDLRKSFEGLSDLVQNRFKENPASGHLFVFANRGRTRIKILYFDGTGTWVCAKRLPSGTFSWPEVGEKESPSVSIAAQELTLVLSGIDLQKTRTRERWWRPN